MKTKKQIETEIKRLEKLIKDKKMFTIDDREIISIEISKLEWVLE